MFCFFSENYLLKWSKEGLAKDLDQLNNLRVLFTVRKFYILYSNLSFFKFYFYFLNVYAILTCIFCVKSGEALHKQKVTDTHKKKGIHGTANDVTSFYPDDDHRSDMKHRFQMCL